MSSENSKISVLVMAGVSSGSGKTTATVALSLKLKALGLKVITFKCGPDYLDPTYHKRATGTDCHNLDSWIMGKEALLATFYQEAKGFDVALIEGVMGLYDGASVKNEAGSTAQIAKWLNAPVMLVCDASGMARTFYMLVKAFKELDPDLNIIGAMASRVGSLGHLKLLKDAFKDNEIVFGLAKNKDYAFPERHLGLVSAKDSSLTQPAFEALARVEDNFIDAGYLFKRLQDQAIFLEGSELWDEWAYTKDKYKGVKIGIAKDSAFHFYYPYNLSFLEFLGCELVPFSPIADKSIPDVDALYFGGGYPEVFAKELSENTSMIKSIQSFFKSDGPIFAECGGFMYLCSSIELLDQSVFSLCGLIDGKIKMAEKLQELGYVEAVSLIDSVLGDKGIRFRGHKFRYSGFTPEPSESCKALSLRKKRNDAITDEGISKRNLLASYLHIHFASNPSLAISFAKNAEKYQKERLS